ncbi:hypothetical protein EXIGLDRAFT_569273, partial [Exidia glandulosa HHB12029]
RAVKTVTQILRTVCESNQKDWPPMLPMVEFAINSSISATSGFAPFELNLTYMPRMVTLPAS